MMAFKREYGFDFDKIRRKVLKRDKHTCQMCHKKTKRPNLHHIYKWADNPYLRYDEDNLITLCIGCHRSIKGKEHHFTSLFITLVHQNKESQ